MLLNVHPRWLSVNLYYTTESAHSSPTLAEHADDVGEHGMPLVYIYALPIDK